MNDFQLAESLIGVQVTVLAAGAPIDPIHHYTGQIGTVLGFDLVCTTTARERVTSYIPILNVQMPDGVTITANVFEVAPATT